jgi:transposase
VLSKCGIFVPVADVFGAAGAAMLDQLQLPAPYTARVASLRRVIDGVSFEITLLADRVAADLARDRGYLAIRVIPGIGPILATIFVVEIGDITRFSTPAQPLFLGHQGPQRADHQTGSGCQRWAAIEAIQ